MDCIIVDDEAMSRNLIEEYVVQTQSLNLVKICEDAEDAHQTVTKRPIDLVFLDIEMPGMNGVELIKCLERDLQVIFTTSKKKYAHEAFDLNVTDYLLKPFNYSRFLQAITKAHQLRYLRSESTHDQSQIFVRKDNQLLKIDLDNILWIEAMADYVTIYTADDKYTVYSTMKNMEAKLDERQFVRIHRSYIIPLDKIKLVEGQEVTINGTTLPIGGSYKEGLMQRLTLI